MLPEEPLAKQKEICDKFVNKIKAEIIDHLGVIIERVYWHGVEDGFFYKKEEIKDQNNEHTSSRDLQNRKS